MTTAQRCKLVTPLNSEFESFTSPFTRGNYPVNLKQNFYKSGFQHEYMG